MRLFWERGYEKTSMQDLVERMGVHKRSMYDTFGDKHSLYLRSLDRYIGAAEADLSAALAKDAGPARGLRTVLTTSIPDGSTPARLLRGQLRLGDGARRPGGRDRVGEFFTASEQAHPRTRARGPACRRDPR